MVGHMQKRLQNRIAESRWALTVCLIYAAGIMLLGGVIEKGLWLQTACLAISTLMMVELNNSNSLIRIYSRMVSCSFLLLNVMLPQQAESAEGAIVQLCIIGFYLSLFHAYQDKRAPGWVFYAFMSVSLASIVWVQMLYYVPLLWILLATNILAFSGRTFWASVLGLALPYWCLLAFHLLNGDLQPLADHFSKLAVFGPIARIDSLNGNECLAMAFVAVLSLTGIIHFVRNSYRDKIRTRMLYEMFITMVVVTMVFMVLQPQHSEKIMGILIVSAAPLTGHFLALTSTKVTNIAFIVILATTLIITAINIWVPLSTF